MGSLLFDFDKYNIKPEAIPALNETFKVFLMNPALRVLVNGHTDSIGSEAYNQRLSEKRAKAVLDYLVGRGIDPSRLKAVGHGESRPIASNETEEGRARNRRVEFSHMP
jgi:OOP family OmpA-OmpF porin